MGNYQSESYTTDEEVCDVQGIPQDRDLAAPGLHQAPENDSEGLSLLKSARLARARAAIHAETLNDLAFQEDQKSDFHEFRAGQYRALAQRQLGQLNEDVPTPDDLE